MIDFYSVFNLQLRKNFDSMSPIVYMECRMPHSPEDKKNVSLPARRIRGQVVEALSALESGEPVWRFCKQITSVRGA